MVLTSSSNPRVAAAGVSGDVECDQFYLDGRQSCRTEGSAVDTEHSRALTIADGSSFSISSYQAFVSEMGTCSEENAAERQRSCHHNGVQSSAGLLTNNSENNMNSSNVDKCRVE